MAARCRPHTLDELWERPISTIDLINDNEENTNIATKENILTETLALISSAVNEDFAANNVSKREEHLHQFRVSEFLRQVVDEEVAPLGP